MTIRDLKKRLKDFDIGDDFDLEVCVGSHKRFLYFDKIFLAHSRNKKKFTLQIVTFGEWKGVERKPDHKDIEEGLNITRGA
jgi:hypothetical protein